MSDYLNHENARTPEQKALMERIEKDGVCPFCAEHFATYHPKPILKETEYWFFTENMSPYEGTRHHFIFVYKPAHISHIDELPPEAIVDLFALVNEATHRFSIIGGSFFMRFGETRYTGSSVTHLHAHLLMGDADASDHAPVRVKLG
ncbi:MAG: hypothetical protein AAB582_01285 [Patescibacteria group bacterium]